MENKVIGILIVEKSCFYLIENSPEILIGLRNTGKFL